MTKMYGPYVGPDGRKRIQIVHDDGRHQIKSYPKYLLEQKIGRELEGDETCDHIDEDFTNDDPNNLQVLTRIQNATKAMLFRPVEMYSFNCPVCKTYTSKPMSQVRHNWNLGKSGPVCSKSCAGLVGKNLTVHETTYEFDPITKEVIVTSNSWEID